VHANRVEGTMIKITRLGGEVFILNADLIQYVEQRPDTFITLTTGQRLVVAESMDEVLRRAVAYQQAKQLIPPPADGPNQCEPTRRASEPACVRTVPVEE
jgi:flagellar protein FlbD